MGNTNSDTILIPANQVNGTNVYNSDQEGYFTKFRQATSTIGTCTGGGRGASVWYCPGEEVILTIIGGELGTDADWIWYEAQCGNATVIGTGDSLTVYPMVSTTYYVLAESITNSTACISFTVNIVSTTAIEIISDSITCLGSDFNLAASGSGTID